MQRLVVETGLNEDEALVSLAENMKKVIAAAEVLNLSVTWGEIKTKNLPNVGTVATVNCTLGEI